MSSRKEGEDAQQGSVRMCCQKVFIIGLGLVLGDFGEDSRKQGLASDWTLSLESRYLQFLFIRQKE